TAGQRDSRHVDAGPRSNLDPARTAGQAEADRTGCGVVRLRLNPSGARPYARAFDADVNGLSERAPAGAAGGEDRPHSGIPEHDSPFLRRRNENATATPSATPVEGDGMEDAMRNPEVDEAATVCDGFPYAVSQNSTNPSPAKEPTKVNSRWPPAGLLTSSV